MMPICDVLATGKLYEFKNGLHADIPWAKPGIYTIWEGNVFIYVGIAGRGLNVNVEHKKMRGLRDRLDSHWKGRRSGDQFAIYVCDRLVLPKLLPKQIQDVGAGKLSLDALAVKSQ